MWDLPLQWFMGVRGYCCPSLLRSGGCEARWDPRSCGSLPASHCRESAARRAPVLRPGTGLGGPVGRGDCLRLPPESALGRIPVSSSECSKRPRVGDGGRGLGRTDPGSHAAGASQIKPATLVPVPRFVRSTRALCLVSFNFVSQAHCTAVHCT